MPSSNSSTTISSSGIGFSSCCSFLSFFFCSAASSFSSFLRAHTTRTNPTMIIDIHPYWILFSFSPRMAAARMRVVMSWRLEKTRTHMCTHTHACTHARTHTHTHTHTHLSCQHCSFGNKHPDVQCTVIHLSIICLRSLSESVATQIKVLRTCVNQLCSMARYRGQKKLSVAQVDVFLQTERPRLQQWHEWGQRIFFYLFFFFSFIPDDQQLFVPSRESAYVRKQSLPVWPPKLKEMPLPFPWLKVKGE